MQRNSPAPRDLDQSRLDWMIHAGKRETDTIGFLPIASLRRHLEAGQVIIAKRDYFMTGYLMHGPINPGGATQIHQLMVVEPHRRQGIGRHLVEELTRRARSNGVTRLVLNCGLDLEANHFWRAVGFDQAYTRPGGYRRKRIIARYYKEISPTGPKARQAEKTIAQDDQGRVPTPSLDL